jgi:ferritin-like metal-binding protein YciE
MHDLKHLYIEELRDLYSAESQLIKALPKMAKAASNSELRTAFETHLEQTRGHQQNLEQLFRTHGEKPAGKHCKGMEGLIAEGEEMIKEGKEKGADPDVLDAGLISAAQRVEHYEIAGYGSVRTFASKLGLMEDKMVLQQILDQEGQTDLLLTRIAMGEGTTEGINNRAVGHGGSESSGRSGGSDKSSSSSSSGRSGSGASAQSGSGSSSGSSGSFGNQSGSQSGSRSGSSEKSMSRESSSGNGSSNGGSSNGKSGSKSSSGGSKESSSSKEKSTSHN